MNVYVHIKIHKRKPKKIKERKHIIHRVHSEVAEQPCIFATLQKGKGQLWTFGKDTWVPINLIVFHNLTPYMTA